jgi:hypothetical protein
MMFKNRKGQGLSLSVIIIAALALIVLVVLVMVFTGRIGIFEQGLSNEGDSELVKMRISYGTCHPSATQESQFSNSLSQAESETIEEEVKSQFKTEVSRCKTNTAKVDCETSNCVWS